MILALLCAGALFLVGLSLSSHSVPGYPDIHPLSAGRVSVIAFSVWAFTAGLFVVAAVVFAIAERRESGTRSVLRLPRTQSLLTWLVLAMALLTALTLMNNGQARRELPAKEPAESSSPIGPEELSQPPPMPGAESSSEGKPSVRRAPTASSPWAVYAIAMATLALAGVVAALALSPGRKPFAAAPEAAPEQAGDDHAIDPAWSDEEATCAIQQEPDPRAAVIMCYRLFQSMLEQAGVRIEKHHTPEECGRIAVSSLKLPRRAVFRLVGLYSRARFSEHYVSESHKSAALAEVRQIATYVREILAARDEAGDEAAAEVRDEARAEARAEAESKEVPDTVAFGPKRA
jgi:hypothetical protein